jgi:hypothetical protein
LLTKIINKSKGGIRLTKVYATREEINSCYECPLFSKGCLYHNNDVNNIPKECILEELDESSKNEEREWLQLQKFACSSFSHNQFIHSSSVHPGLNDFLISSAIQYTTAKYFLFVLFDDGTSGLLIGILIIFFPRNAFFFINISFLNIYYLYEKKEKKG